MITTLFEDEPEPVAAWMAPVGFIGGRRLADAPMKQLAQEDPRAGSAIRAASLARRERRASFHLTARRFVIACLAFALVVLGAAPAHAQHGDWLLGSFAFQGASQPSEGIYYSNLFDYYHVSGSGFASNNAAACGKHNKTCVGGNFGGSGNLDLFVDAHIFTWTSPLKVLGATYGANLIVPFVIVDASGSATLEPVLTGAGSSLSLPAGGGGGGSTKGSIGNIYVEPVNFGWHFKYFDAVVSSGFFAPSGPYNSGTRLNVGFGHWTGVFGLGGVAYADAAHTWSLSIYAHYLLYASQMGRDYTLGDEVPFEWAAGKTIDINSDIVKQATIGAVGYAQWQVTNNSIDATPSSKAGIQAVDQLSSTKEQIYAAGPGISLLTKFGLYSLRWYEEFGANAAPSGSQLMFSVTLPLPKPSFLTN
jgi:hypothetical protein